MGNSKKIQSSFILGNGILKMYFFQSIDRFLKMFYYFGLSPKFNKTYQPCSSRCSAISLFILLISLDIGNTIFMNFYRVKIDKSIENIMGNVFIICDAIMSIVVFVQSFFLGHILVNILEKFHGISILFSNVHNFQINYNQLRHSFSRKFTFVLICYLQTIIMFIIEHYPFRMGVINILIFKTVQFICAICLIHVVFYIEILRFHLKQLNVVVKNDMDIVLLGKHYKDTAILKKIKSYKTIYYRLWDISQQINYVFGWTIVALLLQVFCDSTNISYWFYMSLRNRRRLISTFRMYFAVLL